MDKAKINGRFEIFGGRTNLSARTLKQWIDVIYLKVKRVMNAILGKWSNKPGLPVNIFVNLY